MMTRTRTRPLFVARCFAVTAIGLGALTAPATASPEHPVLGFSISDLRLERWARDRDYFIEAAEKLGATVNVQSANADEQRQIQQIETMIAQGVDAIVIVPFNSEVLTNSVAEAKSADIPVVSYDRLILNADVDAYISFDNTRVGEMQAQGVVDAQPTGRYFLLGGSPTDNNAKLLRRGQMNVLQPLVDTGAIEIIGDQWAKEWSPTEALSIIENVLTANANDVDAIVASNDETAGGAIQALAAQGLAGTVAVSGQDADLAGVRRVVEGTQTMTVYKPLRQIASEAAKLAVQLVHGDQPDYTDKIDNGMKDVDSVLLTPINITKDNVDVLIDDGFYTKAQVHGQP